MGAYRLRCHFVWVFALLYVAAAFLGPRLGRSEFYPFFNWSLFSYTHSVRSFPVVLIHEINGKRFEKPVLYHDIGRELLTYPGGSPIRLNKMLYDLRSAQERGDSTRADALLKNIRGNYFRRAISAEYEIAMILYNPIGRYNNKSAFHVWKSLARGRK